MRRNSILIVDDEKNVIKLLEKVFKKDGYITYTADCAKEALDIIDKNHIDIVITDIKMPGMNGIELLGEINRIDASINVILITAFATIDTAIEALKMGAKDYIIKPFKLEDVMLSANNVIGNIEKNDDNSTENYFSTKSSKMKKILDLIKQVADTKTTIMIYGETGTGKELASKAIHGLSSRGNKPFIKVNCAAIPETLLESELFGYERGAFTGASISKPGRFELADEGTIFLDEIGDITPLMQVKLLRVMQEREFERLGGTKTIKVDVRIIAATNKNLKEMVKKGIFREDLYYRLNVVPIELPPLRERKEDITFLAEYFLEKSAHISGRSKKDISNEVIDKLMYYNWPGNIRELENVIERCVVITRGDLIQLGDLPEYIVNYKEDAEEELEYNLNSAVDNAEREIIIKILKECNGNRTKASEILGISRRSLHRKIIKYNIDE
ncbi:sigma-54-dependent transcriptional regulator [Clostridium thailandense]|uniref:Sigma-54-dependent Fis family transcriptional regulator n=1 Tax=Clostridium thailandense TaxID=2794346 RepID=A0A949TZ21_9CLOT|nr:sigma-54 dependent transcriptional regulator [Clostridium thailandense]MBV7276281.1 sigma-54-dependent Fis family transcriptional regulator [Clostridium thailandense]MCH5137982.1 sigma-54-dependent Fis family transcriptional regulator [Clostridiaceae bacterium UIB06]